MLGDEPQHVVGDRELEVVLRRFLAQDRDAVLEVRLADIGHHPPLEARDQPVFEAGDLLGRPVRGQHHLLAGLEQRVEGVEELVLGHFLAFQEMHVVHQEEVDVVAVAAPELRHGARLDALDHFVDELLGADVEQPGLGVALEHRVRDRLHQVRLAEPRRPVDEQRVVGLPGGFRDGVGRRGGQLVRLADDEALEGVALVEGRRERGRRDGAGGFARRDEEIHLRPLLAVFVHAEHHGGGTTEHTLRGARQHGGVLRFVPVDRELIGGAQHDARVVERDRHRRFEPRADRRVGQLASRLVEEALPGFFR